MQPYTLLLSILCRYALPLPSFPIVADVNKQASYLRILTDVATLHFLKYRLLQCPLTACYEKPLVNVAVKFNTFCKQRRRLAKMLTEWNMFLTMLKQVAPTESWKYRELNYLDLLAILQHFATGTRIIFMCDFRSVCNYYTNKMNERTKIQKFRLMLGWQIILKIGMIIYFWQ